MNYQPSKLYKEERVWFFGTLGLLLMVFGAYTYFVSASVVHVVIRKEINHEILKVSSFVSELEAEYIEAQHSVSNDIASLEGYEMVEDKIFIDRTETSLVLSHNNDG